MGCEESRVLVDNYCFFRFFSWLLLASFQLSFPPWLPLSYTNLAGQEFASGLCGFAFFLFEFVFYRLETSPLNFCGSTTQASRNHGRHGK